MSLWLAGFMSECLNNIDCELDFEFTFFWTLINILTCKSLEKKIFPLILASVSLEVIETFAN